MFLTVKRVRPEDPNFKANIGHTEKDCLKPNKRIKGQGKACSLWLHGMPETHGPGEVLEREGIVLAREPYSRQAECLGLWQFPSSSYNQVL